MQQPNAQPQNARVRAAHIAADHMNRTHDWTHGLTFGSARDLERILRYARAAAEAERDAALVAALSDLIKDAAREANAQRRQHVGQPIVIVPCGASKLTHPAPAGQLYTGSYHRMCRSAASALNGRVLILSAAYGLLELDTLVQPYDLRMGDPGSVTLEQVADQLDGLGIPLDADVTVLAGRKYADVVSAIWPHARRPLDGATSMGEHRARMAGMVREATDGRPACEFCGFCTHHTDVHTYGAGDQVPCESCPGGVCPRGGSLDDLVAAEQEADAFDTGAHPIVKATAVERTTATFQLAVDEIDTVVASATWPVDVADQVVAVVADLRPHQAAQAEPRYQVRVEPDHPFGSGLVVDMLLGHPVAQFSGPDPVGRAHQEAARLNGPLDADDLVVRPGGAGGADVFQRGAGAGPLLRLAGDQVDDFAASLVRAASGPEAVELATRLELAAPRVVELVDVDHSQCAGSLCVHLDPSASYGRRMYVDTSDPAVAHLADGQLGPDGDDRRPVSPAALDGRADVWHAVDDVDPAPLDIKAPAWPSAGSIGAGKSDLMPWRWPAATQLVDVPPVGPLELCDQPADRGIEAYRPSPDGAAFGSLDWVVYVCASHIQAHRERITNAVGGAYIRPDGPARPSLCGRVYHYAENAGEGWNAPTDPPVAPQVPDLTPLTGIVQDVVQDAPTGAELDAQLAAIAAELGEDVQHVRDMYDAMACCADEERIAADIAAEEAGAARLVPAFIEPTQP